MGSYETFEMLEAACSLPLKSGSSKIKSRREWKQKTGSNNEIISMHGPKCHVKSGYSVSHKDEVDSNSE
jgi:hypothetical protein